MSSDQAEMQKLAFLLADIAKSLDNEPDKALLTASQEMGWLLSRNVPRLAECMMSTYPEIKEDNSMFRAYFFLLDFLEAVVKETGSSMIFLCHYQSLNFIFIGCR